MNGGFVVQFWLLVELVLSVKILNWMLGREDPRIFIDFLVGAIINVCFVFKLLFRWTLVLIGFQNTLGITV